MMGSRTSVVKHMERLYPASRIANTASVSTSRSSTLPESVNMIFEKQMGPHVIFLSREECSGSGRSSAAVDGREVERTACRRASGVRQAVCMCTKSLVCGVAERATIFGQPTGISEASIHTEANILWQEGYATEWR